MGIWNDTIPAAAKAALKEGDNIWEASGRQSAISTSQSCGNIPPFRTVPNKAPADIHHFTPNSSNKAPSVWTKEYIATAPCSVSLCSGGHLSILSQSLAKVGGGGWLGIWSDPGDDSVDPKALFLIDVGRPASLANMRKMGKAPVKEQVSWTCCGANSFPKIASANKICACAFWISFSWSSENPTLKRFLANSASAKYAKAVANRQTTPQAQFCRKTNSVHCRCGHAMPRPRQAFGALVASPKKRQTQAR